MSTFPEAKSVSGAGKAGVRGKGVLMKISFGKYSRPFLLLPIGLLASSMGVKVGLTEHLNSAAYLFLFGVFCLLSFLIKTNIVFWERFYAKQLIQEMTAEELLVVHARLASRLDRWYQKSIDFERGLREQSASSLPENPEKAIAILRKRRRSYERSVARSVMRAKDTFWGVAELLVSWSPLEGVRSYKERLRP